MRHSAPAHSRLQLQKVIPVFTGYIAVCIPAAWECLTKRSGPNPFRLFASLCLRCVHLAMKCNQETLWFTWSGGLRLPISSWI